MHKNPIWLAFLICVIGATLWYGVDAAWKLWNYQTLTQTTQPTHITFSVHEAASDKFFLQANYTFTIEGKEYEGSTLLRSKLYRNRTSAEQATATQEPLPVFYNPKNPAYSTLQKSVPFKECLYTAILIGLLVYFTWIGTSICKQFH